MISCALIADQPHWAYHAQAKGIKKYNQPCSTNVTFDRILFNDYLKNGSTNYLESFDVLLVMGIYLYRQHRNLLKDLNVPVATVSHIHSPGYNRHQPVPYPDWKVSCGQDADALGVINKEQQRLFQTYHDMNPYYVINGVDLDKFPVKEAPFSKKGSLKVGWVGNPDKERKRFKTLERAVNNVDNVELVTQTSALQDYDDDRIPHEEMYNVYHDMDLYTCLALHEGLPTPLPEAMSCGIPVITTRCGIVDELNDHTGIGYLYDNDEFNDLQEQVEDYLRLWREDDGSIARKHGHANRQEIERHWEWGKVVQSWAKLVRGAHNG